MLLVDRLAELDLLLRAGLRVSQWWQRVEIRGNVRPRLRIGQTGAHDRVHVLAVALELRKICELFDEVGTTLSRERGNDCSRIADRAGAVTTGAARGVYLRAALRVRV